MNKLKELMENRKIQLLPFLLINLIAVIVIFFVVFETDLFPTQKWGYLTKDGEFAIESIYDEAKEYSEGLAPVSINNNWGFIDENGNRVIDLQYKDAEKFSEGLAAVNENNNWGYIDKKGRIIVTPEYNEAYPFSEGLALTKNFDREFGFVDKNGKVVIKHSYEEAGSFNDGLAPVEMKRQGWGYINKDNNFVVKPEYEEAQEFSEGLAAVMKEMNNNERWGFINTKGEVVIKLSFAGAKKFKNGLAAVSINDNWGFINKSGSIVINPDFSEVKSFNEDMAAVQIDDRWGYINKNGEMVIDAEFESANDFNSDIASVEKNGVWQFIDKNGNIISNYQFSDIRNFSGNMAAVELNKWGFENEDGELIIGLKYNAVSNFQEGLAPVNMDGQWGYIDKNGNVMIEPQFDRASQFSPDKMTPGLAAVNIDGKWGFINKTGKVVIEPRYEEVKDFQERLAAVKIDGNWGFINKTGEMVIEPIFQRVNSFSDGKSIVQIDDQWRTINKEGKILTDEQLKDFRIPLGDWINSGLDFLTTNLSPLTKTFSVFFEGGYNKFAQLLSAPTPSDIIFIFGIIIILYGIVKGIKDKYSVKEIIKVEILTKVLLAIIIVSKYTLISPIFYIIAGVIVAGLFILYRQMITSFEVKDTFILELLTIGSVALITLSRLGMIHPFIIAAIIAIIAWRIGNIKIALFTFVGFLFIWSLDLWQPTLQTISLVLISTLIAVVIGIPLGILAGISKGFNKVITPILDFMQTLPAFVYLIPAIPFFGLGPVSAIFATIIFSIPPAIRLTGLGIRQVPADLIEAADAFGTTKPQKLVKIQIPLATNTIMAGINQTIMLSLSMVVIAAMIGAGGLGGEVWKAIQRLKPGMGFEAGIAVVIVAMILDRITQQVAKEKKEIPRIKKNLLTKFVDDFFNKLFYTPKPKEIEEVKDKEEMEKERERKEEKPKEDKEE